MRRADGRPAGNGKHKTGTGIAGRPVRDLLVDYLGNPRYKQAGVAVLRLLAKLSPGRISRPTTRALTA